MSKKIAGFLGSGAKSALGQIKSDFGGSAGGFLSDVLGGALRPKGNLADWQHAARVFADNNFALSPKYKFLYHVTFNLNEAVVNKMLGNWDKRHNLDINVLVKSVELPKYTIRTETKNMYNRKKALQTGIQYSPINITFHDDNNGLSTQLWAAYYQYYYRDGTYASTDAADRPNQTASSYSRFNTFQGSASNSYRYGLDNESYEPFFTSIQISQMARKQVTTFTLVNPIIENWNHDRVDYADGSGVCENSMSVLYESVFYSDGVVEDGIAPSGFARSGYDLVPSSLSAGNASSLFGKFGVLAGGSSVLSDLANGKAGIGTILTAARTVSSAKNLSSKGIGGELSGALGGLAGIAAIGAIGMVAPSIGKIAGAVFPSAGQGDQDTTQAVSTPSE